MNDHIEEYPERESKILEFKEKTHKFNALVQTCVAFANTAGGQIIVGVEDATRRIVGVSDKDRERLLEEFPQCLYDSTNNGLFAHIYEKNLNDVSVMVIEVPISAKRPCFIKKEGIPKGVYLRVGAATRRAHVTHVKELMRESRHQYYDAEPTTALFSDLAENRLHQCYSQSYSEKKLESDGVITRFSVSHKRVVATVAGVLMFSDTPEKIIPEANILCTQFAGTSGRNIIQTREISGPIPDLLFESIQLIENWLQRNYELQGAKLVGQLPIPAVALRECITNALIHRKYTIPGAVKIAVYDDRLEVFSPGSFPGLVDIKNLGDGTTYLRNPHIAKLARRLKIVEKLGTGIKLIFESCQLMGIRKPEYREDGDYVKVIFYFAPSIEKMDSDEDVIIKLLQKLKEISIAQLTDHLGISRNTATRKLNGLIATKQVIRKGKGPATRYLLNQIIVSS